MHVLVEFLEHFSLFFPQTLVHGVLQVVAGPKLERAPCGVALLESADFVLTVGVRAIQWGMHSVFQWREDAMESIARWVSTARQCEYCVLVRYNLKPHSHDLRIDLDREDDAPTIAL